MLEEYRGHDMLVDRVVRVHHKAREEATPNDFDARVTGFMPNGNLQAVRIDTGDTVVLSAEEVSLRPA